jgi:hypothetical protein
MSRRWALGPQGQCPRLRAADGEESVLVLTDLFAGKISLLPFFAPITSSSLMQLILSVAVGESSKLRSSIKSNGDGH